MAEHYDQQASIPGTLLISEGTFISASSGGYNNVPGIYNEDQIASWRTITDAVHAKDSYIYCQLWALGRAARPEVAEKEGFTVNGPSNVGLEGRATPVPMTVDKIHEKVAAYANAAKNAIKAGFDGVEIHGANGYLIDQFIQDMANKRTDQYGGSVQNRSRFVVEVVKAVSEAVGPERTSIRLSPFSTFQEMGMEDPIPQFSDLIRQISRFNLAYLHLMQPRISGGSDVESSDSLDFAINLWNGPLLIAGGFRASSAREFVDSEHPSKTLIVVFGRYFISNPDLVFRIKEGLDLTPYNRDTFYNPKLPEGYIDYPYSEKFQHK